MASYINSIATPVLGSNNGDNEDGTSQNGEALMGLKQERTDGSRLNHGGDGQNGLKPNIGKTDKDILEPVAVVGLSIKFPGDATSPELFWKMMMEKRCASKDYPADRMNIDAFYHPDPKKLSRISTRGAHFIEEDIRAFDAPFFGIPPVEAATLDPQQRGLLETTYQALENAGITIEKIAGSNTSVHVGCFTADFITMNWRDSQQIPKYSATGTAASILANRISWFYDLQGVSMTVDTACSSGMVALDLACNGIWSGECDTAICAGASVIFSPELNIALSNMNFLSSDAKCYSFDHRANGYARGEGFGVLVLKPVSQAIKDGDTVRALIRSVGVNQDGHTSGGITQPSKDLQARLIKNTYRKAGLDMGKTRFFEAHGTGTSIGDPTEARAIGECFRNYRSPKEPLYVGAAKSNVGHLEGTSGIAGVIKAILAVEKGIILPNTNFERLNPQIDAEFLNLEFPSKAIPWPCLGIRRASVNSFGFGGTNSHVIIDDAYHYLRAKGLCGNHFTAIEPQTEDLIESDELVMLESTCAKSVELTKEVPSKLLVWSAADEEGLYRLSNLYSQHFKEFLHVKNEKIIDNLSFTLNTRRSSLAWKSFVVVKSSDDLSSISQAISKPIRATVTRPRLGFVFTGQGAQWYGMGRELLGYPVFKASLLRSQTLLRDLACEWFLLDELSKDQHTTRVNDPEHSQPLCTALQIALVDLYASLDVTPSVVVGHSSGEIAAAYCAGLLSQASAMKVAYYRGVLSSKVVRSTSIRYSMISLGLSPANANSQILGLEREQPQRFKSMNITIGCINSPSNVTVSGPLDQLSLLSSHLQKQSIFVRQLKVDLAYHSSQMEVIASEYMEHLQSLEDRDSPSNSLMISSVTCKAVKADIVCKGKYWVQNMVSPVQFSEAMTLCCRRSPRESIIKKLDRSHQEEVITDAWVELGPHSALRGPIRDILKSLDRSNEVTYDSALVRDSPASDTFLSSVGRLYCQNAPVNLAKLHISNSTSASPLAVLPDLPQYPFNHSTIYWEESQSSKRLLFREHASHDLLGAQVIDWNPMEAKWSFIIKVENLPWITDHKVNGSMLYPAAGMLAAAIEAVKLMTKDMPPVGYEIRDVQFSAPLLLTTSATGTEIQLSLNSSSRSSARNSHNYQFRIFSRNNDDTWAEICWGSIRADYGRVTSDVDDGREANELLSQIKFLHGEAFTSCNSHVDAIKMYRQMREEVGIEYGPSFRVLDHIHYNAQGEAMAMIETSREHAVHSSASYVVHPTTLDGLFQLIFVALTKGGNTTLQTMVPTRVGRVWVSSLVEKTFSPAVLQVHARARLLSRRSAQCCITALDDVSQALRIQIQDLETTAVSGHTPSLSEHEDAKKLCYHMSWKPDLDTLSSQCIQKFCESIRQDEVEPIQWFNDLELMTLCFSAQALKSSYKLVQNMEERSPSLDRYCSWLQAKLDQYLAAGPVEDRQHRKDLLEDKEYLEELCARIDINKRGQLHVKVGKELHNILVEATPPLELLFGKQELLVDFYTEMIMSSQAFDLAARYLDALVHKTPNLEFIEIGAGTGATTRTLLGALAASPSTPLFKQYTFTDIGPAFLEKARENFSGQKRLCFRILDIEEDPCTQGFCEGQYDVLVASLVFHATKDLSMTLQRARKLLKPGGKLILMELTEPDSVHSGFIFGLLPGWWLGSESFRQQNPCISVDRWNETLRKNGFSGNDLVFRDYRTKECHMWSIIVSTAVAPTSEVPKFQNVNLVLDIDSEDQLKLAEELTKTDDVSRRPIRKLSLEEATLVPDPSTQHQIIILDYSSYTLSSIDPANFSSLQRLITTSASLLWVTRCGGSAPSSPHHGILQGLSRVCRNENPKVAFVTVALETAHGSLSPVKDAATILKVLERSEAGLANKVFEPEYTQVDGMLHINRLVEAEGPNEHVFLRTAQPVRTREFEGFPPLKLNVRTPGLLDSLEFVEDASFEESLAPDEIEVDVQAIGVNFKDCLIVLGRVDSEKLGSEFAGIILSVGSGCSQFQQGDRVTVFDFECYRTRVRVKESQAVKIPDGMSFVEAASIPTTFSTAYYSLIEVARLQKEESVLIHAGAGGTGQAAIQLAANIGSEIFTTVSSMQKKKLLMEIYNLDEDHIFYSRDTSFVDGIKRMTGGRGVDVVLNSLSGDGLTASWGCVAPFGRFLEIGRRDIDAGGQLPMAPFIKNLSFIGVDLTGLAEQRPAFGGRILQTVVSMFEAQKLHPAYPLHAYQLQNIDKAFRFLQSGKSSGKVVLEVNKSAKLPIVERAISDFVFGSDVSYLIAGGLGGIGRSIARWLVRRGAKNLLLLSRSGPHGKEGALALLSEMREKRIRVECPVCDIVDARALQSVLRQYSETMPPIKGCFQASMVLRDSTFAAMSYEDWTQGVEPKVQGSWNLHEALPKGLDFFVLLSSVCGVFGNGGQSNYAAGNTFQDALAQYRVSLGEKATSLDLGVILSEGFVAENQHIMDRLMRLSLLLPISQDELFALLDLYCNPSTQLPDPVQSQVVIGLELPANQMTKGKEVLVAMQQPLFRQMHEIDTTATSTSNKKEQTQDLRARFTGATSLANAASIVSQALRTKMSRILGIDHDQIRLDSRVESFGVDSLVALDLRNWLAKEVDADIAVFEFLGASTLSNVGMVAATKSSFRQQSWRGQ